MLSHCIYFLPGKMWEGFLEQRLAKGGKSTACAASVAG
jgi:hypothetical protein